MKKRARLIRIVICILAALAPLVTLDAFAGSCSCKFGAPGTPTNGLNEMDVIFIGKVTSIGEAKDAAGFFDVTFQINKYYKGQKDMTIVVRTPKDARDCGYNFKKDETYLVYAKYQDKVLFTDMCTRTATIAKANVYGDINTLNLVVYGNQAGIEGLETETQQLTNLDPRLRDVLKTDAVFVGEVLGIEPSKDAPDMVDVRLAVLKSYSVGKSLEATVVVRTPKDAKNGGFDFTSSKDNYYIVFANYRNGILYTDTHSRTEDQSKAGPNGDERVLEQLAAGGAYGQDIAEVYPMNKKDNDKLPSAGALWDAIKKLVLSYYPNAQFTVSKDHLIFEYKTRYYVLGDVTSIGTHAGNKIIKGPEKDGILGDVSLVYSGPPNYMSGSGGGLVFSQAQIVIDVENKRSEKYSCYIHLALTSPLGDRPEFRDSLKALIDNFESYL